MWKQNKTNKQNMCREAMGNIQTTMETEDKSGIGMGQRK